MTYEQILLIFDSLPSSYLILRPNAPDFTIVTMNRSFTALTEPDVVNKIGENLFTVFPDNPDNPEATGVNNLRNSLETVIRTKKEHTMPLQRYDVYNSKLEQFEQRYWLPKNSPVLNKEGDLIYIVHSSEEITEKVLLEEREMETQVELQRVNLEHKHILESIADAFLSIDKNWMVGYWNNQAEKIFAISRTEILGKYLWDHIIEGKDNKLYECFNEAMEKNKPTHFEKYYDLQKTWLQVSAYPSSNGLTAFLLDVTERKNAESKLEYNEKRYRSLVENITDGITIMSKNGSVNDVSVSGKKILGYEPEDLLGNPRQDLLHPDDLEKVNEVFRAVITHPEKIQSLEFRFKMPDGTYKWLEGTFRNLLHEEAIQGIILIYRDISVRKSYEEQMIASEEKYRYLFNYNPAIIIIWTLDDLKVREVNQTAIDLYRFSRAEFLQMTALDYRPPQEYDRFLNVLVDLRKVTGATHSGIWTHWNKNEELMYLNASFHPIKLAGKDAILVLGIDVTDKTLLEKKLERERKRKQKEISEAILAAQEAERADLGKELHDNINQVLTTTRLYLEYALAKKGDQDTLLKESHTYISKAIKEIRHLSRTLLPPTLGDISLKQSFEELFKNINGLNGIDLKLAYSLPDEKDIHPNISLNIFRIVQEQLNNILKHSNAAHVNISLRQEKKQIRLRMTDDGIGFDTQKTTPGLGLKNITNRVNLLGGQIEISSAPSEGTILDVRLPNSL